MKWIIDPSPESPGRLAAAQDFFARTFRELTATFLQSSNFASSRARYVLMQRSNP